MSLLFFFFNIASSSAQQGGKNGGGGCGGHAGRARGSSGARCPERSALGVELHRLLGGHRRGRLPWFAGVTPGSVPGRWRGVPSAGVAPAPRCPGLARCQPAWARGAGTKGRCAARPRLPGAAVAPGGRVGAACQGGHRDGAPRRGRRPAGIAAVLRFGSTVACGGCRLAVWGGRAWRVGAVGSPGEGAQGDAAFRRPGLDLNKHKIIAGRGAGGGVGQAAGGRAHRSRHLHQAKAPVPQFPQPTPCQGGGIWQLVPCLLGTRGARSRARRVNAGIGSPRPPAHALPGPETQPAPGSGNNSGHCAAAARRGHPAAAAAWEGAAGGRQVDFVSPLRAAP